ncbi:MAG TPA: potassium/proton antiporter [Burkholderiaceae bacterium]|nr:potassium/proton antiporter [Burkholderiaceae bacterium]
MQPFYLLLLAAGLLVLVSLLAGVLSTRLGLPFLLVFLVAGMLVGVDGPIGVRFDNAQFSAWVGNAGLAMILLEGGISTRMETFRLGVRPAALLATVGVALTAALVGAVAMATMHVDWRYGLLLGAIVGSTDAAAVFSLLRQTGVRLSERVAATLELESGLNDPMAVFLVLALLALLKADTGAADVLWLFARQAGFGAAIGLSAAWALGWLLSRLPLGVEQGGVLALIVVSAGLAVFALTGLVEGSGFLAIYLFGLLLRARAERAAHAASSALDGFAWAAQATLFLLLGLLVSPHDLLPALGPTLAVAAILIFVARPLAVALCLWPMGFAVRERLFIGWVGLRGAVPIVLALFPLMENVPDSYRFFNVAFAVVLASLLLQGTTLGWVAKRLGVVLPPETAPPAHRAVHGQLTLDAELPVADVFAFFQLPLPESGASATLREWLTDKLSRDSVEGDSIEWHGARFRVGRLHEGRIARVGLTLAPKPKPSA